MPSSDRSQESREAAKSLLDQIVEYIQNVEYRPLAVSVIGLCLIFALVCIAVPHLALVLIVIVTGAFVVGFSVLQFRSLNILDTHKVLTLFLELGFGQDSNRVIDQLATGVVDTLAKEISYRLRLLFICGTILGLALIVLVVQGVPEQAQLNPSEVLSVPPATTLMITSTQVITVAPAPALATANFAFDSQSLSTPIPMQPGGQVSIDITPDISPDTIGITFVMPTVTLSARGTPVEEYDVLFKSSLARVTIADVVSDTTNPGSSNDAQGEMITLVNHGEGIDMSGWYLTDNFGHIYHFRSFYLSQASLVRLHTGNGEDSQFDLYWNSSEPLWTDQKPALTLYDNFGAIVDKW